MSPKNHPVGVRLSDEDAAFLQALQIDDAETASEKLRALVQRARTELHGGRSYEASLLRVRELLEPTSRQLRAQELSSRQRSELIADTLYWLPDLVAYLMAGPDALGPLDEDRLTAYEAGLADKTFRFIEAVLRLGVTDRAPCYDPNVITHGARGVLELTQLIQARIAPKERL